MKKDKVGLKEIVAYEKTQMLPLNFTVSYILTPIYAVVCFFAYRCIRCFNGNR